jgi:hypothetical protein
VSVDPGGAQGNLSSYTPAISADGRYVAFHSTANNLVPGDANGFSDIVVKDRQSGVTSLVSVDSAGAQGNGHCYQPSVSGDGRYIAFYSLANNLVPGDTNGFADIFVHDCQSGSTTRASVDSAGAEANASCLYPSISADGRYVTFWSAASTLVAGDTNGWADVFVHDNQTGLTTRVSVDSAGAEGNSNSYQSNISADGRYVAFWSHASNLVAGDTNGFADSFVHDRQTGQTTRISLDSAGGQGDSNSYLGSISADGRYVAFFSYATNLVPGDTNGWSDEFVHDRLTGTTEIVTVATNGTQGNGESGYYAVSISADGRFVVFWSEATNLVAGDTNGFEDVFVRDRQSGTTTRVSVDTSGAEGNNNSGYLFTSISADGRYITFSSFASNLVAGDTNGTYDCFVRDCAASGPGTDMCQPGMAGVIACPCANPPANAPRGCDNSSATGGAQLASSGMASLAGDTLAFLTNGETPSATSILLQGNAEITGGAVFGQGVRCAGGSLKRLYLKTASGGSISAPEAGDPTVSARSAALGDTILAGQMRWYAVYYRDPIVLGGCPATSTLNITQTQLVAWGS